MTEYIGINIENSVKEYLVDKLGISFKKAKDDIKESLLSLEKGFVCGTWGKCKKKCEKVVRSYINQEIESTAYMLRTIAKSVLSISQKKDNVTFRLTTPLTDLTGKWKHDHSFFEMDMSNPSQSKGRLIMGFGPSASGKTYWAIQIIRLMKETEDNFPDSFLSIDGGIYRESSIIYGITRDAAIESCLAGFSNLVVEGFSFFESSMFAAGSIKKNMVDYLTIQSRRISISLYVPETLGDCGGISNIRLKKCKDKYKPFISITGDKKWIGLLIWQHKMGKKCNKENHEKCEGCTKSGKKREEEEGKKYSNKVYRHSMKMGAKHVMKGYRNIIIHNSGGMTTNGVKNKSIIEDYTAYDISEKEKMIRIFKNKQEEFGYRYEYKR